MQDSHAQYTSHHWMLDVRLPGQRESLISEEHVRASMVAEGDRQALAAQQMAIAVRMLQLMAVLMLSKQERTGAMRCNP